MVRGAEDYLRFADKPYSIRSNRLKNVLLLKIRKAKCDYSYFPAGTLHRSSSKKFSRKITWFCAFCPSAVSTGINATMHLPSGARSTFFTLLTEPASCFSDHARVLQMSLHRAERHADRDGGVRGPLARHLSLRQVMSARTGISFFTGKVKRDGGSILKSDREVGMVPDIRVLLATVSLSQGLTGQTLLKRIYEAISNLLPQKTA
jgi:hypothetical protein